MSIIVLILNIEVVIPSFERKELNINEKNRPSYTYSFNNQ